MSTKEDMVETLRERLASVIDRSGVSRSAFAKKVGIDRSTLSQLLSGSSDRLPRVETLEAIASTEQVSIDWLLGLSQQGGLQANIVPHEIEIQPGSRSPSDERLAHWYAEAAGYKVRYVPATIPDLLKTPTVIEYEFVSSAASTPAQRRQIGQELLDYQRRPETDVEVCSARQSLESLAHGWGIWRDLPYDARYEQLAHMIRLTRQLYPTFRWFLFDGVSHFSAPVTIFGPQRAAIYIGQAYLVLNGRDHIQQLITLFDGLIRVAEVQANEVSVYLSELLESL